MRLSWLIMMVCPFLGGGGVGGCRIFGGDAEGRDYRGSVLVWSVGVARQQDLGVLCWSE